MVCQPHRATEWSTVSHQHSFYSCGFPTFSLILFLTANEKTRHNSVFFQSLYDQQKQMFNCLMK
uniref:Uncharacterized protein n=1 Tax=Anguilla anguilla TaxID=7936 RepID=A0A0E9P518_ANGAN